MSNYANESYWDARYKNEKEPFEWLQFYEDLKIHFQDFLQKGDKLLIVGCGNSRMSEQLYDDGFTSITNVDVSSVVIKQMREKYKDRPGLTWITYDVTVGTMPRNRPHVLLNSTYDVIIDKGTLDSILCYKYGEKKVKKMISEMYSILKRNGMYIIISCEGEKLRKKFFFEDGFKWELEVRKLEKPSFFDLSEDEKYHYMYILTKSY